MPSIALFFSSFTNEDEIREELSSSLNLAVVDDNTIIDHICKKGYTTQNKLEHSIYKKTSVFNQFTLERERNIAYLKSSLADNMAEEQNVMYCGYTALLIPHDITHVLKVLIVDSAEIRRERAVEEGVFGKTAMKRILADDKSVFDWTEFLFYKEPFDKSLYDIVIPVGKKSTDDVVDLIKKNYSKTAVLETADSIQAISDFGLAAKVELALLSKGQKVDVEVRVSRVLLMVNKSSFSFSNLTAKLSEIAHTVHGVKNVEVLQGKGYRASIYRDQNFELPPKVLLVDDEKEYVQTLSERLVSRNVGSYAVFDGREALDFIDDDQPDVMVLDLKMPGINGIEVLKQSKKTNPEIEVIILTGHGSEADCETCMNLGAFAYLQKPTDVQKLSATIEEAYQKVVAAREVA